MILTKAKPHLHTEKKIMLTKYDYGHIRFNYLIPVDFLWVSVGKGLGNSYVFNNEYAQETPVL